MHVSVLYLLEIAAIMTPEGLLLNVCKRGLPSSLGIPLSLSL